MTSEERDLTRAFHPEVPPQMGTFEREREAEVQRQLQEQYVALEVVKVLHDCRTLEEEEGVYVMALNVIKGVLGRRNGVPGTLS